MIFYPKGKKKKRALVFHPDGKHDMECVRKGGNRWGEKWLCLKKTVVLNSLPCT